MVKEISRNFDRRSKFSDWSDSCQEVLPKSYHVISLRACFPTLPEALLEALHEALLEALHEALHEALEILRMPSLIRILSGYYPISGLSSDRIIIRPTG